MILNRSHSVQNGFYCFKAQGLNILFLSVYLTYYDNKNLS